MTEEGQEYSDVLVCGHCGNRAPMYLRAFYEQQLSDDPGFEASSTFQLLECPSCEKISLVDILWHDSMEPEDVVTEVIYPAADKLPQGLPEAVLKAYEAALKVKRIDANAFGVLLGRVLELVCEDRGAEGRSLHERLKALSTKGEIPSKLVEVGASLRQLRNVGAHAVLGDLSRREVPVLEGLARAILEYVYTAPLLVMRADNRLKRLKKRS